MSIVVMLDLETMGTSNNAPITAIGAVAYNRETRIHSKIKFYEVVSLKSSVEKGAVMDPDTVIWWMNQSAEAKAIYTEKAQREAAHINTALLEFSIWVEKVKEELQSKEVRMYGCGSTFDNVILRSACERSEIDYPVRFWQDLCYRTIREEFGYNIEWDERGGVFHNALDDAEYQMTHLIKMFNVYGGHR